LYRIRAFQPLLRGPHALTILGNFWPRRYDHSRFPMESRLVRTDEDTQVLVQTQRPRLQGRALPAGEAVLVHGLEGSGDSGYIHSMAWDLLNAGFITHRFHMRTCGGTQHLCKTLYHAGLTADLKVFLQGLSGAPVFLIGFSLGGNVSLKLAGELGETDLIQGVCAISTPIDLAAGVRRIGARDNRIYQRRFLSRMRTRMLATGRYTRAELKRARTLYEIDDRITAPSFGFDGADHYYATQSSRNYLDRIRVPALLLQAKDDVFIPFESYSHPAFESNPFLRLIATEYGGHLGFLSRRRPRFWVDEVAIEFLKSLAAEPVKVFPGNNTR
jgi:predicted alpha/beta-fold hydrolase